MPANADLEPAIPDKFSLRPSRAAKLVTGFAGIAFFLGTNDSVIGWLGLAIGVATILIYRSVRRQHQQSLNAAAATSISARDFVLYLRPFFTSRLLPVRCRLPSLFERWIVGRFWDLELALSLALEGKKLLVAVGDKSGSLGAAKLMSSDEAWQDLVLRLMRDSSAIVLVPFARPGTLWEVAQIFATGELLQKTVLIMPPTTRWQAVWTMLLPWRGSIKSRWNEARAALAASGIRLPAYNPKGALLVSDGTDLRTHEACHFHPGYVSAFLDHRMAAAPEAQTTLAQLIHSFPKRLPITTWIFFFDPIRVAAWLLAAVALRMLLFQPFHMPSGSMHPTFEVGDSFYASRIAYGYSKHSFDLHGQWLPGLPFKFAPLPITGRILAISAPKAGDVAVFKLPRDNATLFVQRIVGLPGDRIQMINGVLHINGAAVLKEADGSYNAVDFDGSVHRIPAFRETLPSGVSYRVLDAIPHSLGDDTGEYVVPAEHYFLLGDHRDNALDSRFQQTGFVPRENLIARADLIYFSLKPEASLWRVSTWRSAIRWHRFPAIVH
jgi:signal peptidase I